MATPTPFALEHRHHSRLVWVSIGIIAIVGVIIGISLYLQNHKHQATQKAKTVIVATPLSYDDFMGIAKKVSADTLSVDAIITDQKGHQQHRSYDVTANTATVIKEITDTSSSDIALDKIAAGDQVQVAAATNIANTPHFTATKILKLSSH